MKENEQSEKQGYANCIGKMQFACADESVQILAEGKVGALAFGLQQTIDGMIDVLVMQPFALPNDAFELESEAFGNCAAAGVFGSALNGNAVELPGMETVLNHRPAARGHDSLSLMPLIQPIGEGSAAVGPIQIEMIDDATKTVFEPDAHVKSAVFGRLLPPDFHCPLDIDWRTENIHPRMPAAQIRPVDLQQLKQFRAVLEINQTEFRLFIRGAVKHRALG